ncbi:MAG: hypothetical protein JXR65_06170 [Bacteroidales bacterium]|nr:hypothetical protein [Bacteroidales bacterium]
MKEHDEQDYIDGIIKEAIQSIPPEKPGKDFMNNLMKEIDRIEAIKPVPVKAKPTISAKGWILVSSVIAIVFALLLSSGQTGQSFPLLSGWYSKISLDFSAISIPNLFTLGMISFLFFFVLEIFFITKRLNNEKLNQ